MEGGGVLMYRHQGGPGYMSCTPVACIHVRPQHLLRPWKWGLQHGRLCRAGPATRRQGRLCACVHVCMCACVRVPVVCVCVCAVQLRVPGVEFSTQLQEMVADYVRPEPSCRLLRAQELMLPVSKGYPCCLPRTYRNLEP